MMNLKEKKAVMPELKIAERFIDVKSLDENMILKHLDEQIRLREMPLEKRMKK